MTASILLTPAGARVSASLARTAWVCWYRRPAHGRVSGVWPNIPATTASPGAIVRRLPGASRAR